MLGHDIVVVGFSAGGIDPLLQMVADLPRDFPAAMFVVHHFPAQSISALPNILSRATVLPAAQAVDDEQIIQGHIYVAPPDQHLLLRNGVVRLTRGPREHGHRPAVDSLFRTAARSFGPRVIAVVLSGALDDGTAGLHAIKAAGGVAVVQDPEHCTYPGMPASAIEHVAVDHIVPPEQLGRLPDGLVRQPAPGPPRNLGPADEIDPADEEPTLLGTAALRGKEPPGPSTLSCPDCGGVLWESGDGNGSTFAAKLDMPTARSRCSPSNGTRWRSRSGARSARSRRRRTCRVAWPSACAAAAVPRGSSSNSRQRPVTRSTDPISFAPLVELVAAGNPT